MNIFNFSKFISAITLTLCLCLGLNLNTDLIDLNLGYSLDRFPSLLGFFGSSSFIWCLLIIIVSSLVIDSFLVKVFVLDIFASILSVLVLTLLLLKVIDQSFFDIFINEVNLSNNRKNLWLEVYNSHLLDLYKSKTLNLLEDLNIFKEITGYEAIRLLGEDFFRDMTLTQIRDSAVNSANLDLVKFLEYVLSLDVIKDDKPQARVSTTAWIVIGVIATVCVGVAVYEFYNGYLHSLIIKPEISAALKADTVATKLKISNENITKLDEKIKALLEYVTRVEDRTLNIVNNQRDQINAIVEYVTRLEDRTLVTINNQRDQINAFEQRYNDHLRGVLQPLVDHVFTMSDGMSTLSQSRLISEISPQYVNLVAQMFITANEIGVLDVPVAQAVADVTAAVLN